MSQRTSSNKLHGKFWYIYAAVVGVFVLCIIIGLIWFRFWLLDYENSERTHIVEAAITMLSVGQYEEVASKTDLVINELYDAETYAAEIEKIAAGKELSFSKAFSYDRFEKPIYYIDADGEHIGKVVLRKSGDKTKNGFDIYEIDYFTAFEVSDHTLSFVIPNYYTAYVNGIELKDIFITQDNLNKNLFTYAVTRNPDPCMRKYEVTGLLQDTEIKVLDELGVEAEIENKDGEYEAHFTTLSFRVPENINVYVNDLMLGESHRVSEGDNAPENISYMLSEDTVVPDTVTYKAEYLVSSPKISMRDELGNEVNYSYNASEGLMSVGYTVYTINAPTGLKVTANGIEISGDTRWRTASDLQTADLMTINDEYLSSKPTMSEYKVAVIEGALSVQVVNFLGQTVDVPLDSENLSYTFNFSVTGDTEQYTSLAIERSQWYSRYISADLSKQQFLAQILPNQKMYDELKDHPQGFYTGHQRYWFENVETSNLKVYNENCFSCEVSYDHYIAQIRTDPDFKACLETHTRFWFVLYNGAWYMAEWTIL